MAQDEEGEKTAITELAALLSPQKASQRAYLIVLAGQNVGAIHRLSSEKNTLGRGNDCEVRLIDDGVSRKHARLVRRTNAELLLEDLGSTNGTFVDGKRVEGSVVLRDGDRFQLGRTTLLKFSLSDELEESFQRRLYESSVRDGLTGLYNRKHLDERLAAEFSFATRHGTALSFVLLDLDHFKQINDTFGHPMGDLVLKAVGKRLQGAVRTEDVVARYGGEEFGILARGITVEQSTMLADRIRTIIEKLEIPTSGPGPLKVTVSAGVATYGPVLYPSVGALVEAADNALYEAKQGGRNRVVVSRA